jgi:hypothetical protein
MNWIVLFLNYVLRSESLESVLVYNFTNSHAMFSDLIDLLVPVVVLSKNPQSVLGVVTFSSLLSQIARLSNSYRHVSCRIFEPHIAGDDDLFQKCP